MIPSDVQSNCFISKELLEKEFHVCILDTLNSCRNVLENLHHLRPQILYSHFFVVSNLSSMASGTMLPLTGQPWYCIRQLCGVCCALFLSK